MIGTTHDGAAPRRRDPVRSRVYKSVLVHRASGDHTRIRREGGRSGSFWKSIPSSSSLRDWGAGETNLARGCGTENAFAYTGGSCRRTALISRVVGVQCSVELSGSLRVAVGGRTASRQASAVSAHARGLVLAFLAEKRDGNNQEREI